MTQLKDIARQVLDFIEQAAISGQKISTSLWDEIAESSVFLSKISKSRNAISSLSKFLSEYPSIEYFDLTLRKEDAGDFDGANLKNLRLVDANGDQISFDSFDQDELHDAFESEGLVALFLGFEDNHCRKTIMSSDLKGREVDDIFKLVSPNVWNEYMGYFDQPLVEVYSSKKDRQSISA